MKTLDLQRWKKLRLQLALTVRIDFATEFYSSIHQNLRFNNFKLFLKAIIVTWNVTASELRSLSFFWKIPLQTFQIQSCMYKSFWRLHPSFENKKGRMKKWFATIAFHSVLTQLRILIWSKSCFWPSAFVFQPPNSPLKNTVNEIRYSRKNQ